LLIMETKKLLKNLSSFNLKLRKESLLEISKLIKNGKIKKFEKLTPWLNLHLHTFHSFNYENWSPARVIFECWRRGLKYAGTVDFDTLAGLEETLSTGEILGILATGGFESRVLVEEWKDVVINSPNEPGIYYLCGKGFKRTLDADTEEGRFFLNLKKVAQARNREVVDKLNSFLGKVTVNYDIDVLPLTPSGNPTERHIIESYKRKSEQLIPNKSDTFWSEVLSVPVDSLREKEPAEFLETMRKVLIKSGGPGYIPPERESFPKFDDVVKIIKKAGGIPVGTWLDGTNKGEEDPNIFVSFLKDKGIEAMAIIPERNYNFPEGEEKEKKVLNFNRFMQACMDVKMPVVCGTELNKYGQPFVDDFSKPEISIYLNYFLDSASLFF